MYGLNLKIVATGLASFVAFTAQAGTKLTPEEIAAKSFAIQKVADSTSKSRFRLINANGQERVRETEGVTKLIPGTTDNQRLVKFLSPADVKGTKTLLIEHTGKDDDIWIYLPALKKVRRLVSSDKKSSFVGTDFSYGDVIGQRPEEWSHTVVGEETVDGKKCYVMESKPKTKEIAENSGYSFRKSWIDQESFVAVKAEFKDLSDKPLKILTQSKIEKVDVKNNKWQPMQLMAKNLQTGHSTVIEFYDYKANVGVDAKQFVSSALEK